MSPDAIHTSLSGVAGAVERVAGDRWSFELRNGVAFAAQARVDDGWMILEAPAATAESSAPANETLLRWNASLDGGARFVRSARCPQPCLRAEVPLDAGVPLAPRIAAACAGFATARGLLHHSEAVALAPVDGCTAEALLVRCRETAWPVKTREPGRVVVDLEVRDAFHQAEVRCGADGRIAATVPVFDPTATRDADTTAICRRALALLLVRTSGVVRVVRAVLDDDASPRFEAVYAEPSGVELAHAFAALSIACRVAGAAAAVLRDDESAAAVYLRQWDDAVARRAT